MKRLLRNTAEACIFFALVFAALFSVSRLVERKASRKFFDAFLEDPRAYDVLFFGDSRFMNGMLPLEIWEDYGIAGYNLSCHGSSLPVTYWSLCNALDYAQPKLVVIAVDGVTGAEKITGSSGDLHMAFDFYPLTRTKMRAIEDLMYDSEAPDAVDDEGNLYRDIKWEYYLKLGKYHGRWKELTKEDWRRRPYTGNGGEMLVGVMPYEEYEIIEADVYAEETGHGFAYLRKAIETCQSRGVEVMLVNTLSLAMLRDQMAANTAASIAEEYGVDFVDITRLDCIVDYMVDCYDRQPHLNVSGTQKVTDYLGSYIRSRYDLPDRRKDVRYHEWAGRHDAYQDEKMQLIRQQSELNNILMMLHDDDYDMSMYIGPNAPVYSDDLAIVLMHNIAREHVLAGEEYEKGSASMYPLEGFDDALWNPKPYYLKRRGGQVSEYTGEKAHVMTEQEFGKTDENAILLKVFDRRTGAVVKQFEF